MDLAKFQKNPAGRLLRARVGSDEYWALAPDPLPPEIVFDTQIVRMLSAADRALGELAGLGRTLPNPHLLVAPFIRREAVLSSRIEGTRTNIAELYAYEIGQPSLQGLSPAQSADAQEVLNYVHALESGLSRLQTFPLTLSFVCELHKVWGCPELTDTHNRG